MRYTKAFFKGIDIRLHNTIKLSIQGSGENKTVYIYENGMYDVDFEGVRQREAKRLEKEKARFAKMKALLDDQYLKRKSQADSIKKRLTTFAQCLDEVVQSQDDVSAAKVDSVEV